jgi:hypothetical protein
VLSSTRIIEAHNQVCPLRLADKIINLFFPVNPVVGGRSAVGDAHAHAHPADVIPATYFIGGFLSLEIEVDNVFHRLLLRQFRRCDFMRLPEGEKEKVTEMRLKSLK